MALLIDLPTDVLLEIILCLYHSYVQPASGGSKVPVLWPLSQTCKLLNICCGHWIFRKYYLRLRSSAGGSLKCKYLTPLDNSRTLKFWNFDAVTARLQHFREKASYVRELILEDAGENGDGGQPFPDCIVPDLMDALGCATNLLSFVVTCGEKGTLPLPVWNWVTTKNLVRFSVGAQLAAPAGAQAHPMVIDFFEGFLVKDTMTFLDLIQPEQINLHYRFYSMPRPPIHPYMPSGSRHPYLRKIVLQVALDIIEFTSPLFDFQDVPNATIIAQFRMSFLVRTDIPLRWKSLKPKLQVAFAEGLDGYDVARPPFSENTMVYRPPLAEIEGGWKPINTAHLDGEKEQQEEAKEAKEAKEAEEAWRIAQSKNSHRPYDSGHRRGRVWDL